MFRLLIEARAHWLAMSEFREQRERCKNYTYGRQWSDAVVVDGMRMREEDYIRSQGNIPLKNNLIRRLVRNVIGVFRNQYTLPTIEDLNITPTAESERIFQKISDSANDNSLTELYSRSMEEFLISGICVHRKWLGARDGEPRMLTETVQPDSFFIDSEMRDFRGWDANAVGQLHDVDFASLCAAFAATPDDRERLRILYADAGRGMLAGYCRSFGVGEEMATDFLTPSRPGRCRVIEYWRKEQRARYRCHDTADGTLFRIEESDYQRCVEEENLRRLERARETGGEAPALIEADWMIDEVWRYYFLTPTGEALRSGDSPLPHRGHPYVFKAYPFIDGEIHSFVADCIDQQRYINRLITLYDWIMRASAKGVLLFPEGALPDGVDIDDISEEWSRFNGVIVFRPKAGMPLPQQVSSNATNIGITELLEVQLKMMEDVSGVNSALQGKMEGGVVSGTLYNMQIRNALTGLLDILESFASFMRDAAMLEYRYFAAVMEGNQRF